ncbi:DNA recombination protein RmuC [Cytophagales bacterium LB-30]|uniref:DNA recombination protein RmuC n=1 Tax=Shiella aurantiaca TaxID=3058365 RepID=A0ABT8F6U7_9BACT|nr:DNA recombination protein RmuC [Shiella aurantiaca]MDN4166213.1 DNA recombination protein RmuC [Shiella aurantiaca]
MDFLFLFAGMAAGALIAWFYAQSTLSAKAQQQLQQSEAQRVAAQEKNTGLAKEIEDYKQQLQQEREKVLSLSSKQAETEANYRNLQAKLEEQAKDLQKLQDQFAIQFKNLANDIFEEKGKRFAEQNKTQLSDILSPLKEKIQSFEKKVEESNKEGLERNTALREQINQLKELNVQITKEAENLTKALKGDSKTQGNWGEMQLEAILEKVGLQKDVHYFKEKNYKNEEGQNQRLDYIIKMPDDKYLVLDSKVSLTAYSNYFNADTEAEQAKYLKAHFESIQSHIKLLSEKNYQNLYEINQPDYVMMFVANEPALSIALREDIGLYEKALDKNIVLVSTSTLLATLRTISYIWKQDLQNKNALEIARQAGSLYDKFVALSEDLKKVGNNLITTQNSYQEAMGKLYQGKDNLVRKTERLRELGAKTTKQIDQRLIDRADD